MPINYKKKCPNCSENISVLDLLRRTKLKISCGGCGCRLTRNSVVFWIASFVTILLTFSLLSILADKIFVGTYMNGGAIVYAPRFLPAPLVGAMVTAFTYVLYYIIVFPFFEFRKVEKG